MKASGCRLQRVVARGEQVRTYRRVVARRANIVALASARMAWLYQVRALEDSQMKLVVLTVPIVRQILAKQNFLLPCLCIVIDSKAEKEPHNLGMERRFLHVPSYNRYRTSSLPTLYDFLHGLQLSNTLNTSYY
jgi:hypothetical protein